MSAVLPGAGQVYNRKYWKVPFVYAGLGLGGYLTWRQWQQYQTYRQAYAQRLAGKADPFPYLSDAQLKEYILCYRTNLEWAAAFTLAWYGLNILDAVVDAHLATFDISDNLTLVPDFSSGMSGFRCTLRF